MPSTYRNQVDRYHWYIVLTIILCFSDTGVYGILNLKIKKGGSSSEGTFYNNRDINEPYAQDTFNITKIT
jgi:hypothetical protein